ncbi:MAG: UDP-N-acetylglucosamine--N-acetylmuramyl-(pentapeptide) pyrophosphoryl-undecaprenol N-acetylglucosamine transferase [Phycisphaeraceae bacterium]|nr:UDP-N-acetylglucosamine--N-acetylmuramyl-(pentapeptide) pyrophosphoryl-undecaprenol N-acetylglucosamine transferase [Phycisphaeraceae bacterium]
MNGGKPIEQSLRVIFAGGGTGGHLYPALAIAEQLTERAEGIESEFFCSTRPLDARILTEESAKFVAIPARPFSMRPRALAGFLWSWRSVVARCRRQLSREAKQGKTIVVAMGGFVSAPVVAAAKKEGLRVVLVNLDATPGRANRWVAGRSDAVFTAAEIAGDATWKRVRPIVRWAAIADGDRPFCRRELGLDPELKTLLVTGASQGARTINRLMVALLEHQRRAFEGWQVIHQCGPVAVAKDSLDEKAIAVAYEKAGVRSIVKPLFREMGRVWGASDLAIGRCGAGSVGEAWANRVPSVFMPYPYHKDQHQRQNALPLEHAGGATIVKDEIDVAANEAEAGTVLVSLMADGAKREAMREKLRELGPADGASAIADAILAMV